MIDEPIDFDAYRRRIGFDGSPTPSLNTLAQLIERHASTVAFENIDVLAGRVPASISLRCSKKSCRAAVAATASSRTRCFSLC